MDNTFDKLFEIKKCPARALQETIFDFIKLEFWTRDMTTHDILGEKLTLKCVKPDRKIEFYKGRDGAFVELPIQMRTDKWELLVTVNWRLPLDEEGQFSLNEEWLNKFQMHCFKGDTKDLKTTFMTIKLIGDIEENW